MAATLLELPPRGDVATISDDSKLDRIQLLTPQQLYELWERQQWLSQEIDFSGRQRRPRAARAGPE